MISVIMLTFNREKYIRKMIEDVLQQTYKQFEYIIVDNGSTDNSGCIAEEYAEIDNRIKVIRLERAYSIGFGRNIGLQVAKGEYVAYIDDDDRLENDYLEFLVNLTDNQSADLAMCGADEVLNGKTKPQCMFMEKYVLTAQEAVIELLKREHIRAGMPTKLIRRTLLEKYPFSEMCLSEDVHTIYKYLGDASKVVLHGVVKYHFIRHGDNNSIFTSDYRKLTKELLEEYLDVYKERAVYLSRMFPKQKEFFRYNVWSFMISMCEKIQKYEIKECFKQYNSIRSDLLKDREEILDCKFLTQKEKTQMNRLNIGNVMPSFDVDRQFLGKIYPLRTPFNVIIDISEACNFKCSYCFRADSDITHWGYAMNNQLMQWDTFEKTVEQILEFPQEVKQISLSNHGEPLCNRNLPNMVRHIKKRGIKSKVAIHTNASLLDEEYVFDLADSDIDRVVISLQGITAQKYEKVCGIKINFDMFYNNIRLLYRQKKNTQIHIKIADIALEENEKERFLQLFAPISDRVFVEQVVPIWKGVKLDIPETSIVKNKYGLNFPKQKCCPLIFHTIVVAPNGDVYPCTQLLSKNLLYNINEKTLLDSWNCKERTELLLKQVDLQSDDLCSDCYILQNSIFAKEDMIDKYRIDIRKRMVGE